MFDVLNKDEIVQLRQFRFTTENKLSELSIPLNKLLDENVLLVQPYLHLPFFRYTN